MHRTVFTSAAVLVTAAASAQTLGDERVPVPDEAELAAIDRAVAERESARLFGLRHRLRPYVELGAAVLRAREDVANGLGLRREPAPAVAVALGVRYGLASLFELHGRVEAIGPFGVGAIDEGAFARTAMTPCEGALHYDYAPGTGLLLSLEVGARARVFTSRSPFYVGVGARLGMQSSFGEGGYAIRCVDAAGAERSRVTGRTPIAAQALDLGAVLETGYRFGEDERWDVGLRLLVQRIGDEGMGVAGAQVALGWSLR